MDYTMVLNKISEVFINCNVKSFPIDCFKILNNYGFKLYTYTEIKKQKPALYKMCCKYSNDAFQYNKTIYYNENKVRGRIRFTLMHELGHYLLGHKESTAEAEDEANCFASNFLAPRIIIHKGRYITADKIHDTFGLSYAAANRAVFDYNRRFQRRHVSMVQATEAEKTIALMFYPKPGKESASFDEPHLSHKEDFLFSHRENQLSYRSL